MRLPLDDGLALIFDLDGVIVDSMPLHHLAWEQYLASLGVGAEGLVERMHGRRNDEIVRDFLGSSPSDEEVHAHGAAKEQLFREMMRAQLKHYLVPGIFQILELTQSAQGETSVPANGPVPVALATNAERANVDFTLDGANLRGFFHAIVDGSQVDRPKPVPDVYLRAARELGVAPPNCIVFEDSPVGVAAASAAGAIVVGIETQSSPVEGVSLSVKDFRSPDLMDFLAQQRRR